MKRQITTCKSRSYKSSPRIARLSILTIFAMAAAVIFGAGLRPDAVQSKISDGPQAKENAIETKAEIKKPGRNDSAQSDETDDAAVWGKRFPLHYELFKKTVDQKRTRFGGSEAIQVTPKESDPRSVVAQSRLEEDPRLVTMWKGYAFSVDFREERGHAYMLDDQTFTGRQAVVKQPGSCINCHASTYLTYKRLGEGDLIKGFDALNKMPFAEARKEVSHPVSCIDCHDSKTMKLRVTKPAFMIGIAAFKASQGIKDYDVNRDATRNEMRSFVCGQCHVEYYFKGEGKTLTFPWSNGLKVDNILAYYDDVKHKDWVHKETGAEVLKAQHPEFEMFNQGSHGRAGVSCADCHMPKTAGPTKITDHWVRSPLLNIAQSCQACHKADADEMKARAETIQTRTYELRNLAMDALMDLIAQIKAAKEAGKTDADLAAARDYQRKAQFYLDFIEAENSMGFHAPQESTRILGESINFSRFGLMSLSGFKPVHPFQTQPAKAPAE
ncbi:MAG: ammonia-forming cytochrome c nitrite reductase subunit c552 [Pyrinomonadaceae bacterium]|nr:ammonia-forming cytochrome c nitrite reductase subunit c552 [Pyrinomonadaceae bacterium]